MILSGLAIALFQEAQGPATPQDQFEAWAAGLPSAIPIPLTQSYAWRISFTAIENEDSTKDEITRFLSGLGCQGVLRFVIADSGRFKIELNARLYGKLEDGSDFNFECVLGCAADGEQLKAYADIDPSEGVERVHAGAEIPLAQARLVLDAYRDYLLATASATPLPSDVQQQVKVLWPANLRLMDLLHPRGYAFQAIATTPVAAFSSARGMVRMEFLPEPELWEGLMSFSANAAEESPEQAAETRKKILLSTRMSMLADAATGQPLQWSVQADLPLKALEPGNANWIQGRFSLESDGFSTAAPQAADLAAREGFTWFDGRPFVQLALTKLKQMTDEAVASEDEEF